MAARLKTLQHPSLKGLRVVPARPARQATLAGAVADVETSAAAPAEEEVGLLRPVDRVISARVVFDDVGEASVEYLAKWKVRQLVCFAGDNSCIHNPGLNNSTYFRS